MDTNYNRIHNYASAETMYKNLALAVGMVILGIEKMLTLKLVFVLRVGVVVLIRRCVRFADKKAQYSLVGFMEKYSGMVR